MMAALREWLIGVISISVMCAAADSLMPEGSVKRVGKLVCGLAMVCALMQPLMRLGGADISDWITANAGDSESEDILMQQSSHIQKSVIEAHYAAYISDKAAELGVICAAEVDCICHTDGVYLPQRARIWGDFSDEQQSRLTQLIEVELGLSVLEQSYYRTEEDTS